MALYKLIININSSDSNEPRDSDLVPEVKKFAVQYAYTRVTLRHGFFSYLCETVFISMNAVLLRMEPTQKFLPNYI